MIPYIQNLLNSFEAMASLSTQANLIEAPKRANDASINSNEMDQTEFFSDKIFEKAKFTRLKTIILKSITKGIAVLIKNDPAANYMFKFNNRNTRTRCEICLKSTIKTPEQRHWRRYDVFIVNSEHISHLALVFLLLNLSREKN